MNQTQFSTDAESGMALRDHFAKQALPSVLKQWLKDARNDGMSSLLEEDGEPTDFAIHVAKEAYALADAMLKVRSA